MEQSPTFEICLKRVQKRRFMTPNQNGVKSSLRKEDTIVEVDLFDECDLEIMAILARINSDDQIDLDYELDYERCKCPVLFC